MIVSPPVLAMTHIGHGGMVLLALGALLLLLSLPMLGLYVLRRVRVRLSYSPVRFQRWLWATCISVGILGLGVGLLSFDGLLHTYQPVETGEPVGVIRIVEGQVHVRSAFDDRTRVLGAAPGGRFVLIYDRVILPSWVESLRVPRHWHRARGLGPAAFVPGRGESPPEDDRLYRLVGAAWFPGSVQTARTPALSSGGGAMGLYYMGEGGYGLTPYPGS